jgi:DNA-directed RNA polymerase specialized sigma24 family protein
MTISIKNKINTDAVLLQSFRLGDEIAYYSIRQKYGFRVARVAHKYLQSDTLAEDVLVEVFLELRAKRSEIEAIEDFLFTTTKRITLSHLKEIGREYQKSGRKKKVGFLQKVVTFLRNYF